MDRLSVVRPDINVRPWYATLPRRMRLAYYLRDHQNPRDFVPLSLSVGLRPPKATSKPAAHLLMPPLRLIKSQRLIRTLRLFCPIIICEPFHQEYSVTLYHFAMIAFRSSIGNSTRRSGSKVRPVPLTVTVP